MMTVLSNNYLQIGAHPFERPQGEVVRFTMYRELYVLDFNRPLPGGYTAVQWADHFLPAAASIIRTAFAGMPESEKYAGLSSTNGCLKMLEDLTLMAGFDPESSWMVFYRNEPVGLILCSKAPNLVFGEILLVAVAMRHRMNGIATHMVNKGLQSFDNRKIKHVTLQVNRSSRRAVRFFRGLGFHVNSAAVYR
jgi:ribosomal protein S18 acetylase RimI-like enzyme